ncbi:MAG: acetylornithine deacetylase [Polyangiaceae bacterium]
MNLIGEVLSHLASLVRFDTRNPPREITAGDSSIFGYLRASLGSEFRHEIVDLGDGCISLLSVRGSPKWLFNFHLDTVPADPGWAQDPHELRVVDDRAFGLGACDTKGAMACALVAAAHTTNDVALLFTSDEEAGSSRCVKHFLGTKPSYEGVIVAEPTAGKAILEHRGIATSTGVFSGTAGHASSPGALSASALHEATRWASRALEFAASCDGDTHGSLNGIRFNLGVVQGGTKPNMIASRAEVKFGTRPRPDQVGITLLESIWALAVDPSRVTWTPGFLAPSLPCRPSLAETQIAVDAAKEWALSMGLEIGAPVDFWTEAFCSRHSRFAGNRAWRRSHRASTHGGRIRRALTARVGTCLASSHSLDSLSCSVPRTLSAHCRRGRSRFVGHTAPSARSPTVGHDARHSRHYRSIAAESRHSQRGRGVPQAVFVR